MKFSTREDIEAPIETVFEALSDFSGFERWALRRGARIERLDGGTRTEAGARWQVEFDFRGKRREVTATVSRFEPPEGYRITSVSSGLEGETSVELVALAQDRTRLLFAQELRPTTLAARLMLQSLKLAKGSLEARLDKRIDDLARTIEKRRRAGRA
ncbi:hypothetical protein OG2516_09825 [Oceanicola granulosus HTCC2516]|uniref:SRPBCC family protein n=1 Tax=Oceanicola granulosus (strain ATCC BAA-861 / DSM 15982 / KCTC 12143 / HTCC2516) TaxID=314256 RepID=Q2CCT9_OCEGH|nr:SRPBCC family protein [Oceanicola granulosus]EAR50534.1 hypothetical protein OG2516_09825 [Oceanicola granulosus HTCC2516]